MSMLDVIIINHLYLLVASGLAFIVCISPTPMLDNPMQIAVLNFMDGKPGNTVSRIGISNSQPVITANAVANPSNDVV